MVLPQVAELRYNAINNINLKTVLLPPCPSAFKMGPFVRINIYASIYIYINIYLRWVQASFLATTSTDEALCSSLGADRVIDYRQTNW